jgi:hypothetical protein
MKRAAPFVAVIAIATSLLPGAVADGRVGPRFHKLRMDGYVGPPSKGRRARADLQLRARGENVRFQVTSAGVISGDTSAPTIFNRVRPYRPNFILRGPKALIGKVADAARGAKLRIVGAWRPGSRDLMVSSVTKR